ncbi:MAG TPA: EpsI family protein, partial [Usitatibacter sp.]|nr:EpsI family protein [Usitatibacter sp.]
AYAHGPIVLAVFAGLVWRARDALLEESGTRAIWPGAALFALGLILYVFGRALALTLFEVASHIPLIAGLLLMMRGVGALKRLGFALLFLFFMIPLPGFILDTLTVPLKAIVSALVEFILQAAGYPIERSGVVLAVGPYQMLVADACAGLNSLYSLLALGLLYLHLTGPSSKARIALVAAAIIPIAIAANVIRVVALVLITYYWGEEAAQGYLHGFAGMGVFASALVMLLALDKILRRHLKNGGKSAPAPEFLPARAPDAAQLRYARMRTVRSAALALVAMLAAAAAVPALKPAPAENPLFALEAIVPAAFGDWHIDPEVIPLAPAPDVQANLERIYRQIVSRTYVNARGERMMLTVAYGGDQSDALKAHRQEACYAAQGFEIHALEYSQLNAAGRSVPVTRLLAVRGERFEPVTYWFTMGERVVRGRLERLKVQLAAGLSGRMPDGMLVRVSNLSADAPRAFAAQQAFIASLFAAMPASEAARFVGVARG